MEKKTNGLKAGCSKILWVLMVILLCVPPMAWAYTEFLSGEHTINSLIEGEVWVFPDASVTMEGEAHIANATDPFEEGNMYVVGIVVIHAGIVDGFIDTMTGLGTVTVYGTDFAVDTGTIVDGSWKPGSGSGTLTGTYENGDPISLLFNSDFPIFLVDTGGPSTISVEIDIKPGSDPNPINPGSNGLIPVAILTTVDFDASTVDPDSVTLDGAEVAVRGKSEKLMARLEDIDGDGENDLILQVDTQSWAELWEGGEVVLTGKTYGGEDIRGTDEVIIVPPE